MFFLLLLFGWLFFSLGFFFLNFKDAHELVAVKSTYIKSFLMSGWKMIRVEGPHCRRQAPPWNVNALSLEDGSVCPAKCDQRLCQHRGCHCSPCKHTTSVGSCS